MKLFNNLNEEQKQELLKYPAYISLLAAFRNDKLDEGEKKSAINCAHSQTLSCDSLLIEFYKEADKVFEYNLEQLDKDLPEEMVTREAVIKKEIVNLEKIVGMLGKAYASTLHQSLEAFKEHISNVHHSVIGDFTLPSLSGIF